MAKLPKNFKVTKDGKVIRKQRVLDASAAIRQKNSKKQRVVKRGTSA